MRTGRIGTLSLGIACIAIGVCVLLATLGIVPWRLLGDAWPVIIILFGIELIVYHFVHPHRRLEWNGPAFAVLCVLFVASIGDLVGTRVAYTFTGGVLPWNTAPFTLPVAGQVPVKGGISLLQVHLINADVRIVGQPNQMLRYNGQLSIRAQSQQAARAELRSDWQVRQSGNILTIALRPKRSNRFNLSTGLTQKGHLTIYVPNQLSVALSTINGELVVNNINGDAQAQTLNGSIHLTNVRQWAAASTLNGQITLLNIGADVNAQTTNGDVTLRGLHGGGHVRVINGSVNASFARMQGDWSISTVNGDIRCALPQRTANVQVTAEAPHIRFTGKGWRITHATTGKRWRTAIQGRAAHSLRVNAVNGTVDVGLSSSSL